ncbi:MAG: hypothetical protein Q7S61_06255 [bacterium]|nr:hypothetical protein [bacterium]
MKLLDFINSFLIKTVYAAQPGDPPGGAAAVNVTSSLSAKLPFSVPSLGDLLTFFIRFFFVLAGLAALIYLLLGAFAWVTSGGSKEAVDAAQKKIQAAIVGLILIVAVLAIIVTMEQVVFRQAICIGITCPVTIPELIKDKCDPAIQYYDQNSHQCVNLNVPPTQN